MHPFRTPLLALLAMVTLGALSWGATQSVEAATIDVDAGNIYFCDASFENGICTTTVTAGDTVTWTIVDGFHTVTECDATHTQCGNGFDSGPIGLGETFSQTFTAPGSYNYYCAIHPTGMQGVIVVQPAPTPTPSPTPVPSGQSAGPTPTPGSVPQVGGEPIGGDGLSLPLLALVFGLPMIAAGGAAVLVARKAR